MMLGRITENTDITFLAKCGVSFELPVPPYKMSVVAVIFIRLHGRKLT